MNMSGQVDRRQTCPKDQQEVKFQFRDYNISDTLSEF